MAESSILMLFHRNIKLGGILTSQVMTKVFKVYIFAILEIYMSKYWFLMAERLMLFWKNIKLGGHFTAMLTSKVLTAVVKVDIFASMVICMSYYRFFMMESSILLLFQRNILLGGHLTTILTSKVLTAVVKVDIFCKYGNMYVKLWVFHGGDFNF